MRQAFPQAVKQTDATRVRDVEKGSAWKHSHLRQALGRGSRRRISWPAWPIAQIETRSSLDTLSCPRISGAHPEAEDSADLDG